MKVTRIGITLAAAAGLAVSQTARTDSPAFEIVSVKRHEMPAGQVVFRFATVSGGKAARGEG